MPRSLTITIPSDLYERIRERARRAGRTVDEEAIALLTRALVAEEAEAKLVSAARSDRESSDVPFLTNTDLQNMKRQGRA
jgi:plasmid stability protein